MALRKIKLYGKIGQLFGKEWILDINSVSEAIKAIDVNTKGEFSRYLLKNNNKYYKICVKNKKNILSKEELCGNFGSGDIYITPVIRGSGKYGQVIAGVVMVAAAYFMGGFGAGAAQGTAGSTAAWGSYIGSVGIALTLGGISQLLMTSKSKSEDQRNSYLFQGNASTVYQGTSVGIVYGRALVSPMPVSIASDSLEMNDYSKMKTAEIGDLGDVTSTIQYSAKSSTVWLCGFSEFIVSSPPRLYRKLTMTGNWGGKNMGTSGQVTSTFSATLLGERKFDKYTCAEEGLFHMCYSGLPCNRPNYCSDSIYHYELHFYGVPLVSTTATTRTWSGGDQPFGWCCGDWTCDGSTSTGTTGGYEFVELSEEDTEQDAIDRFMKIYSWSEWGNTPISGNYPLRTSTGFLYRAVRTKTNTNKKYNPNINYKYSVTYQRRANGTTDPFVDAETITGSKRPNANGDIEFDIINVPGYDTIIGNVTITL